jgi:serine/threonine-protein kinase
VSFCRSVPLLVVSNRFAGANLNAFVVGSARETPDAIAVDAASRTARGVHSRPAVAGKPRPRDSAVFVISYGLLRGEAFMKRTTSHFSLDTLDLDLVDWDAHPASPGTASPPSGDATTLRSASSVPDSSHRRTQTTELVWEGLAPGSLIDGKYRVDGELGRGAMGVVVLAHDQSLDRRVAVKLVLSHLASPGFHRRFLEEGRAMARVNHRNVVQVYACGEHGLVPYIVMELVTGSTLEKWMARHDGLVDVGLAVEILAAVCDGVTAIHDADTLHRDIKPSNILLDEDLNPRIADLGVSTFYRSRRASRSEIVGTPAYMAPEVAFRLSDDPPTHRADVYSLACVAYELLTGQMPFRAEDDSQWFMMHATLPVTPPSEIRSDIPSAFDRVLLAALAKDPAERTATVEQFRRDLLMASGQSSEPVRILIAEDDEDFRALVELGLRSEFPDAEIVSASSGRGAIEALSNRTASVAILDLNMPDLGGFEVTQYLRESELTRDMPIIVLTGSGGPAEWRRLLSLGADRFLVKPVSLDDLVASVRHSVKARHSAPDISVVRNHKGVPAATTMAHDSWLVSDENSGKVAAVPPRRGGAP